MQYFKNITDLEIAKQQYRLLAKQLHPDMGGSAIEFQKMQQEYKTLLLQLQQQQKSSVKTYHSSSLENELLSELGKLAKVLIEKQVPQNYLLKKIKITDSKLQKGLFSEIMNFLNGL
ncbi:MAG: hypothetical protein KAS71_00735 [Bacteroidales bacterium]|nr:hypothetical protein [Bacteroidales bacterium]